MAQHERLVQMEEFMNGKKKILVATDVVARGIGVSTRCVHYICVLIYNYVWPHILLYTI
jgi:superfamily II DNA/RNA helicase